MLSKKFRLTKRGSFSYIYRKGQASQTRVLRMQFVRSASLKIGFAVSNKVGKAHVRNLVKRRLRAILRSTVGNIKGGWQIVFSVKNDAKDLSFDLMKNDVDYLLKRNGLVSD